MSCYITACLSNKNLNLFIYIYNLEQFILKQNLVFNWLKKHWQCLNQQLTLSSLKKLFTNKFIISQEIHVNQYFSQAEAIPCTFVFGIFIITIVYHYNYYRLACIVWTVHLNLSIQDFYRLELFFHKFNIELQITEGFWR